MHLAIITREKMTSVSKNTRVLKVGSRRIHRRRGVAVTEESLLRQASKDPDFTPYWIAYRLWAKKEEVQRRRFMIRPTFMLNEHIEDRGNLYFVRIVFEHNENVPHRIPRWFPRYEQARDGLDRNVLHMSVAFGNDAWYYLSEENQPQLHEHVRSLLDDDQWNGNKVFETDMFYGYGHAPFFIRGFNDPRLNWLHEHGSYAGRDFGHGVPYYGGIYPLVQPK